ncbi:BON domain-containing protein [uncultured Sneathiella sp.]|jgi:osmotically-inducible protein OsmY|uniref:BON domain-containing protein n=1 Tax=uncultured Sneathiella sp. TaxID=879315 RepID=UPI0030D87F7A|tara:strand:- start:33353 stop:33946 length:594 start_codon:yes stop_codon:yes gene_type:complete
MKYVASAFLTLFALTFLSGCTPTVILGGAAIGGVAVAEERSVGTVVDDATIKVQIANAIFQKSEPIFTSTSTTVIDGTVLITGEVPTPEDRLMLTKLVWGVKGVKEVHNDVTVAGSESLSNFASDSLITTKLKLKLLRDAEILNINYSVETVNGTVYLMGIAQNEAELQRVKNHAKEISGVRHIVSYVKMKSELNSA